MMAPANDNQNAVLEQALTRFVDERLQGKQPDIAEFVAQYPQCEAQLRDRLQDLEEIDSLFDSLVQADQGDFSGMAAEPDLVGCKIGNFEITKMIGRGGMGVVYLAHDTRLNREVAVKSMPPRRADDATVRMRLHREARLLASVNHANIAMIHDIIESQDGTDYLVLEYVPGQTLAEHIVREPLRIEEVLSIAQQIAEAVAAAHEKGVVHRDLKPGNIKITPEGKVKVLDFGLAKASESEGKDIEITSAEPGHIIGTPAYMSPEQARGNPTDHRTDIWSFGCIVHQMLTGHAPFESDTVTDTLTRIIERQPDWERLPREIPESIRVLLRRCLEKDPERRLEGIAEAAVEIRKTLNLPASNTSVAGRSRWRWALATGFVVAAIAVGLNIGRWREQLSAGPGPGRIESLAVLPLENLSGDPNQEYYSDGMTEALMTELSKIGTLRVISRQSVMRYKGSDKPLSEIARELNVDAVVQGSVLRVADRVRITAQLISAIPERHLWADDYDRDFGDVLILSSEVAQAIAREIRVTLTPEEQVRLTSARPVNPEALDLYLNGKSHYFRMNKKDLEKASEYFQRAIEIDPNYAPAYVGLAASYGHLGWQGHLPLDEARSKTRALHRKALEIDDTLAEAHLSLSEHRWYAYWDWEEGIREMKRALALNPNLAEAHREYASYLMAMGRRAESIAAAKRALQLEPFVPLYRGTLAWIYYLARQYDQAVAQDQLLLELQPENYRRNLGLARTYEQMGRYEDAIEARRKVAVLAGDPLEGIEGLARAYREEGADGYWRWNLEQFKAKYEDDPYRTAALYARLGDKDQAITWLERAYERHNAGMYLLKVDPAFDRLRNAPRFQDLLRRMNFPE